MHSHTVTLAEFSHEIQKLQVISLIQKDRFTAIATRGDMAPPVLNVDPQRPGQDHTFSDLPLPGQFLILEM